MKNVWLIGLLIAGLVSGAVAGFFALQSSSSAHTEEAVESSCIIPPEELDLWNAPSADEILSQIQGVRFETFVELFYQLYLLRFPQQITYFGLADQFDVRNDGLNNYSSTFIEETYRIERLLLDHLYSYDRNALSEDHQFLYDVCEARWSAKIDLQAFSGADYLVTSVYGGSPDWILYDVLTTYHPRKTLADIEDYMMRLSQIENLVDQLIDGLEDRQARGIIAPAPVLRKTQDLLTSMAYVPIEKHPLFANLALMLIANPSLTESLKKIIFADAAQLMATSVIPSYHRLSSKIGELEQVASESIGIQGMPNGDAYYAHLLSVFGETSLSASQIHEWSMGEIEGLESLIREGAAELGLENENLGELLKQIALDGGTYTNDSIPVAFGFAIDRARNLCQSAFDELPSTDVNVEINPFIVAFYRPATLDGTRSAHLSTPRTGDHPKYLVPTQTFHETYPGMHLFVASLQQTELPLILQAELSGAHMLGWAGYAERLAWELGAYEDDAYGNLGRLHEELKRAVLVAIDTGIHAIGWTYEQAAEFYRSHTADSEADREMNVLQAIAHPGSFVPAFIGFHALLEFRQRAEGTLGSRFKLPEFHDAILRHGSLPLALLEHVVDEYIAECKDR